MCQWPDDVGNIPSRPIAGPGRTIPCSPFAQSLVPEGPPHIVTEDDEHVSARDPELALHDSGVACLFRHYTAHLASWYDLNDRKRHFTDVVPTRARQDSLLLSAILAFSAASKGYSDADRGLIDMAAFYHLESVHILINLTNNIDELVFEGDVLAAISLLRSYEIISQNFTSQSHLEGCYSLLASRPVQPRSDLATAAFWNYLREDITVALVHRRRLMMELSDEHVPQELEGDDDYANYITVLLGQVINHCFNQNVGPLGSFKWTSLRRSLEKWKSSLPVSFKPIVSKNHQDNHRPFPFMWTTQGWHAAALQYYQTAMMILDLGEPTSQQRTTIQNMSRISSLTHDLDIRATEVCALALSSDSASVWVNSFGPIAFCAPWLRDQKKLSEVVKDVRHWGTKTGWPVSDIIEALLSTHTEASLITQ